MTNVVHISTAEARREVLISIKNKIKAINKGDAGEPVYLENLRISNKIMPWVDGVSFTLNAVFCDEKEILRGDLMENSKAAGCGIIFGQNIENMDVNHLTNILAALGGPDESAESGKSEGFFKGFLRKVVSE
ncbi:MAG: hypothetical protein LBT84_04775 [Spirochaetia bacterium]|jgi:hypothetical protein|nr:hypothetical protein [Spirochaetia bacterium]